MTPKDQHGPENLTVGRIEFASNQTMTTAAETFNPRNNVVSVEQAHPAASPVSEARNPQELPWKWTRDGIEPAVSEAHGKSEYIVAPTTAGGNETVVKDGIYMSRKPFSELRAEMSPESQQRAAARTKELLAVSEARKQDEPKPCPLCGGKAYATRTVNGTQMFNVGCASCGLELKAAWYRGEDKPTKDILALWNTRAASSSSRTPTPEEKKR